MKRTGLFLAILLVMVVNITLLAGVWYNRSGPPDAVVTLTENELPLVSSGEDDSSIALRIEYRSEELDRAKLEELGFRYPAGDVARDFHLQRQVLLVLELEDEAEKGESRLAVIDAGLDAEQLRRTYRDRSRYIIAPGIVRLYIDEEDEEEEKPQGRLVTSQVHVPKAHAGLLADLQAGDQRPRYTVTLRYGRKLEPWVIKVEPLEAPTP